MEQQKLKKIVLDILQACELGWWKGYDQLIEEVSIAAGEPITIEQLKMVLKQLAKEGMVKVKPMFNVATGKLKGSAYFYNHSYRKNE